MHYWWTPPLIVKCCRDDWLERRKIPFDKYARTTLLVHKQVDRLFLLLAARKYGCHVSLAHMDGVWMSHKDGNMQEMDIMIAQTMDSFCEILQIKDDSNTYDTLADSTCFDTVWTNQLLILDALVLNPEERATDAGYNIHLGDDPHSMRDVLSELMGVPKSTYKGLIQWWFYQHMFDHQISKAW